MRRFGILVLLASIWSCFNACRQDAPIPEVSPPAVERLVLAYHYPWYGWKEPLNWADAESVLDTPLWGSYASGDPALIDAQISLAREAGIDGFLVSWNGATGDHPDQIFQSMLQRAGSAMNFRLSVIYEGVAGVPDRTTQSVVDDLSVLLGQYAANPSFLRWSGKPVVFVYSPQLWTVERWKEVRAAVTLACGPACFVAVPDGWEIDLGILEAFDSLVPYADKYYEESVLEENYHRVAERVHPTGAPVIGALIGGGSRVQKLGFDIDRSEGRYLRRRLDLANTIGADWVTITSWNEWYEAMQIEPSVEYGFDGVKYTREVAAEFHGVPLSPLDGASFHAASAGGGVTVTNTGARNLYHITSPNGRITYLLRPGEARTAAVSAPPSEVSATLVDGTIVGATP